ncbi:MAG: HAD family phosphatase [Candidatus Aenigmatarchaeota archaeon]|nr:MAG: HAD family phosphatase [Candidatus Aenigmarchaeota archaeon]
MIKAVLFDFDGTLVDNMPTHYESLMKALKWEVKIEPMDLYLQEGRHSPDIIADLLKDLNLDEYELRRFVQRKSNLYMKMGENLRIRPEAVKLINKLKKLNYKIGLVTGSPMKYVKLHIKPRHYALFDYVLTGEETEKFKPDPEPYLKCAEKLGMKPEECLAIDNAPIGVESAKSAGMICIGFVSTVSEEQLKRADFVIKELSEAEEIIKKL